MRVLKRRPLVLCVTSLAFVSAQWLGFHQLLTSTNASPMPVTNHAIPSNLLFNHHINLLEACPPHSSACKVDDQAGADNVRLIIAAHPGAVVKFFDDAQCAMALQALRPTLAQRFAAEKDGRFKSDMCRLAMLHVFGGYYFDCDLRVMKDMRTVLKASTRFATIEAYHSQENEYAAHRH